jgi:hypothetical protein
MRFLCCTKGDFDMPNRNRKGPLGEGFMTGRGAGLCAGFAAPGSLNSGAGRGSGMGRGGHKRGWRHQFHAAGLCGWQRAAETATVATPVAFATVADKQEIAALKEQATSLQNTLNQMQKSIEELEARPRPE